ncbi:MAG: hypothetical protein ACR2PT_23825 [Endozoicomonas sp.]
MCSANALAVDGDPHRWQLLAALTRLYDIALSYLHFHQQDLYLLVINSYGKLLQAGAVTLLKLQILSWMFVDGQVIIELRNSLLLLGPVNTVSIILNTVNDLATMYANINEINIPVILELLGLNVHDQIDLV